MFSLIGQTSAPHGIVHIKFIQMGNGVFDREKKWHVSDIKTYLYL